MNTKKYKIFYLLSVTGIILASFYPLMMGIRVISDMIADGTVLKENYPKYIIPYTPICFALIAGVALMPLLMKLFKRFAGIAGSVLSLGVFAGTEFLFENKVVVSSTETVAKLADWQMFLCRYVTPEEYAGEATTVIRTEKPVDILIGEYNPAFKLHFYLISAVIILTVLYCFYEFGKMIVNDDKTKLKSLIMQSAATISFIGMCIWACFTAFYRTGDINVSPLSAVLMSVFFILLGVTVGIFVGSFLIGKKKTLAYIIPAIASSAVTLIMYIGEMILLHGHLYRFGTTFFFDGLPAIVLAPVDILVIIASGAVMYFLARVANK